jgi:hypothetical protein
LTRDPLGELLTVLLAEAALDELVYRLPGGIMAARGMPDNKAVGVGGVGEGD